MHIYFRQYAQQMGMQNIRTLLPEQIDIVLNTSIVDVLNQLIREHIDGTTEKGGADNSKLAQANSFRNLYHVQYITGTAIDKKSEINNFAKYGLAESSIKLITSKLYHFVGASAIFKYKDIDVYKFPIRYIDEQYLAECLNDKFLQPSIKSPIMVIYNQGSLHLDIYIKEKTNVVLSSIEIAYIAKPKELSATQTECDMPEHLHELIVKHAVELYKSSIGQGTTAAQPVQQAQPQYTQTAQ